MAFGWMTHRRRRPFASVPTGRPTSCTSAASHGQSLETTMAQVVADELGLDIDAGAGGAGRHRLGADRPGHGRKPQRGHRRHRGGAGRPARSRPQVVAIVAHALEASPDDLEVVDGRVQVVGHADRGHELRRDRCDGVHGTGELAARACRSAWKATRRFTPVDVLHVVERVPPVRRRGRPRHRSRSRSCGTS